MSSNKGKSRRTSGAANAEKASGAAAGSGWVIPLDSPLIALHPTARRVLEAARSIVAKDGFDCLTLARIQKEAEENSSAVSYYFGGKAGLIRALLEAEFHDEMLAVKELTSDLSEHESIERLVRAMVSIATDTESYIAFYELLPRALRSDEFRETLRTVYDWYRRVERGWLESSAAEVPGVDYETKERLAALMSAVMDGLAIQALIDPAGIDVASTCSMFGEMVESHILTRSSKPSALADG